MLEKVGGEARDDGGEIIVLGNGVEKICLEEIVIFFSNIVVVVYIFDDDFGSTDQPKITKIHFICVLISLAKVSTRLGIVWKKNKLCELF